MSRKYIRTTLRTSWGTEDLDEVMRGVRSKEIKANEASRNFNLQSRSLRKHQYNQYKKLEKVGFDSERKDVKEMAFELADKCNTKNPFSENSEPARKV